MYSTIFACTSFSRSLGEVNSRTKSGQNLSKGSFGSCFTDFHLDLKAQEASGERFAAFGNVNSAFDSKTTPVPSLRAQFASCLLISAFRLEVSGCVGDMIMSSFSAVSSIRASGLSWQKRRNCSGLSPTDSTLITIRYGGSHPAGNDPFFIA